MLAISESAPEQSSYPAVNWRWNLVVQACASEVPAAWSTADTANYDPLLARATLYLRAWGKASTDNKREEIAELFPDIYEAHRIHSGPASNREITRCYVEALVLVNHNLQEIVDRVGINQSSIEAYEYLFFDMRSRLARISTQDLELMVGIKSTPKTIYDPDLTWKWLALRSGLTVLDSLSAFKPVGLF